MADNFGLKIGVEGEKEFKNALREINRDFKVLGSEMKLVTSQFDKQDKSLQAVTARNEVLNKEIDAQKNKISTLESALKNAAESFGENDKRTKAWQIQLNNANADLNKMERELDENNKALDEASDGFGDAGKEADKFGDEIKESAKVADDSGGKFDFTGDPAARIHCGNCGQNFSRNRIKPWEYFRCVSATTNKNLCSSPTLREDLVVKIMINDFRVRFDIEDAKLIKMLQRMLLRDIQFTDEDINQMERDYEKFENRLVEIEDDRKYRLGSIKWLENVKTPL
jgi:predicted  nucleic acid-binding Zn-ribbon protein